MESPWWEIWPGDMDRDGIQDDLELRAAEAQLQDPDARVDLVVDFAGTPPPAAIEGLESMGLEVQYVSRYVDAVLGRARVDSLDHLRAFPGVVMLEAQGVGQPALASAVPSVSLDKVRDNIGYTGKDVTIAVLDTGIMASHISLDDLDDKPSTNDPKVVVFYDAYVNTTREPYDAGEHGTWVAGIAAGTGGDAAVNIGAAPQAMIVGVRVGTEDGFPENVALRGIEWVIDNKDKYNISVMSCSWGILIGGPNAHNGNSAISRAADAAAEAGIITVVSGGNTALSATVTAPGDARQVITVGSVDDEHRLSSFSSEGPTTDGRTKPDVCAPGEDITGPWSDSDTGWYTGDGTSASAPLVAGLAALMVEANPGLTPDQAKRILHETSEHNTARSTKYFRTPNNGYGWGVVDAIGAVRRAEDLTAPPMDIPVNIESGEELQIEVRGTYTRTQYTNRGEDGTSFLGEDRIEIVGKVPSDWDRPSGLSYNMEGSISAITVPDAITQEGDIWRVAVTFRVRENVDSPTTAYPTIIFTTVAPVSTEAETYTLNTRENLNGMEGALGTFRVSVGGNVQPMIEVLSPSNGIHFADSSYTLRWTDDDPDNNAVIDLYSDEDTDPGSGRVLIATGLREDADGDADTFVWDTSTLLGGTSYYIQAVIDDGVNGAVQDYSEGMLTIQHSGNTPPTVEILEPDGQDDRADRSFTITFVSRDPDNVAKIDLFWDIDDRGFDGASIVRGIDESDGIGDYGWDTSDQPDGAMRYIYAVVSDGTNPPAKAYGRGPITIDHQAGPSVESQAPVGQDVALDAIVRVSFDRAMDEAATQQAFSMSPAAPGSFDWVGNTMRFYPIEDLAPNTLYEATVAGTARDTEGRTLGTDHVWTFRTGDDPVTPQPPTVRITSPLEGETVSGTVWVEGSAENVGNGGVVEFRVDDEQWKEASGTEQWTFLWDTTTSLDGPHALLARATDAEAQTSEVYVVNVTVDNQGNRPPSVQAIEDRTVRTDKDVVIQVHATDPDDDELTYSDDTTLFDIDPKTGRIAFKPYDGQVGAHEVTVSVFDGEATTEVTFRVTVEPAEDRPLIDLPFGLTTMQFLVMVLLLVVLVSVAAYIRSARRRNGRSSAGGTRGDGM